MYETVGETSVLSELQNRELAGVTFVRNYVQLLFDGPYLNAYTAPRVRTEFKTFSQKTPGYRDALCEQIGKVVTAAHDEPHQKIAIEFCDGTAIEISLKDEDRLCAEAAILQIDSGKRWKAW